MVVQTFDGTGKSIFNFLSSVFKKHNVPCVLVGGYALIANKIQRMTFDIDFIITPEGMAKIEHDIIQAGYSVFNRQDAFVQFKTELYGFRDIDFLIGDPDTVGELISQGKKISIGGETFVVPSPRHLIAMKLHSMASNSKRETKDMADVIQLMAAHRIDPRKKEIKEMFKKYNATHAYPQIVKAVGALREKKA